MRKNRVKELTFGALIASIYIVLTILSNLFGLASFAIQFRLSECLTVFSYMGPYSIIGLGVGCLLSNILIGANIFDIVFGTIATIIGAIGTYYISKKNDKLLFLPPVLSNMFIIPLVLRYAYALPNTYLYFVLTIGLSEIVTCGILGMLLYKGTKDKIKWIEKK